MFLGAVYVLRCDSPFGIAGGQASDMLKGG
jgi:hypothetical protein